jgi:hypothetical protein
MGTTCRRPHKNFLSKWEPSERDTDTHPILRSIRAMSFQRKRDGNLFSSDRLGCRPR